MGQRKRLALELTGDLPRVMGSVEIAGKYFTEEGAIKDGRGRSTKKTRKICGKGEIENASRVGLLSGKDVVGDPASGRAPSIPNHASGVSQNRME